ncbi:MAG: hypothetical protein AAF757_00285 [Cyanobacteria bacterium P01_D01_bin.116]
MTRIPECDRCRFYSGNFYLTCAVVPGGPDGKECPHFAPDPDIVEAEELWEPEGSRYINDELVIERTYYNGEEIIQPPQRWTQQQQLELLDTHPMFTGKCPSCRAEFDRDYTALVHWDCPECGWKDDSV